MRAKLRTEPWFTGEDTEAQSRRGARGRQTLTHEPSPLLVPSLPAVLLPLSPSLWDPPQTEEPSQALSSGGLDVGV